MGWTDEQLQAINIRQANVLVSAAAGAGKTAVLVERLISRITDKNEPIGVDRILVVTFTNAAASEMKERIGSALMACRQADPDNPYLEKQLLLLNKASISTLHSFCLELIRQNYFKLELPRGLTLDPGFRVGDETETALLKLDVIEDIFEEKYSKEEPLFLELVECYGGKKDDQGLQNLVSKLYSFSRSQRDPAAWLAHTADIFSGKDQDNNTAAYYGILLQSVSGRLEDALTRLQESARLAALPGGPLVYEKTLYDEINGLKEIIRSRDKGWQHVASSLQEYRFNSLKPCRGEVDRDLKEQAQALRNEAKKIIEDIRREYLVRAHDDMEKDMRKMAPLMGYLCSLVAEYAMAYLAAKLEKNIIDFNDIEHLALDLLTSEEDGRMVPSQLAAKIQEHYAEVLVDEYQDINGVQEAILQMVSRQNRDQPNMFMVGDVKQSIYGFRLADPGLFLGKYLAYSPDSAARETLIMLAKNFRSRPLILSGVNFIFRQLMTQRLGGLVYDDKAFLVCGASYPPLLSPEEQGFENFPVEVHLLDKQAETGGEATESSDAGTEEDGSGDQEELDALQEEARIAGRRIQELLGAKIWDRAKGEYRPASYRDMVVLLRSTKGTAEVFLEEFRKMGLPAYADVSGGYLAAMEIRLMLALLQIIDNPRQDLPLAAVLRSPMAGFTSSELASIRRLRPRGDFYDALRLAARKEKGELGGRVLRFLDRLQGWRTYSRRHSLTDLLWLLYRETGYYTYVGALPGGRQRQANLRVLQERARQYEQTTLRGLFKFLRFLDKLEENKGDLGIARALGEKEDVIRIMSVHKSKGLEFPIVIVAGLGKKINFQDLRDDVLVDKDLGLGPQWADLELRLKYPTLARLAVRDKLKIDTLAEESRILYVAMTRAKEALILIGTVKNLDRKLVRWRTALFHNEWELSPGLADGAGSYLDWLVPALLRHRDGQPLRLRCPAGSIEEKKLLKCSWFNDPSRWFIRIWARAALTGNGEIQENKYAVELERISRLEAVDSVEGEDCLIKKRLDWVYPGSSLAGFPAKFSVSELKNHYRKMSQDPAGADLIRHFRRNSRRPAFLREQKGLDAAEKGSALHLVMRHLDLQRVSTPEEIESQLKEMVAGEKLSPVQMKVIDPLTVWGFFRQPIGKRLLASPLVRREVPFTLALHPEELGLAVGADFQDTVLLQGTLDCLFQEGDGFVLIDYKSDVLSQETVEHFKARYQMQLDLYAKAVEAILKVPVQEKVLYSFHLGQAITL